MNGLRFCNLQLPFQFLGIALCASMCILNFASETKAFPNPDPNPEPAPGSLLKLLTGDPDAGSDESPPASSSAHAQKNLLKSARTKNVESRDKCIPNGQKCRAVERSVGGAAGKHGCCNVCVPNVYTCADAFVWDDKR